MPITWLEMMFELFMFEIIFFFVLKVITRQLLFTTATHKLDRCLNCCLKSHVSYVV